MESGSEKKQADDAISPRSRLQSICLVATCTGAMILNTSNATAVSIALPTIGRDLHIAEFKLQWLVSAYSVTSGCFLLLIGRIADLYGRKKTFLIGTAILGAFGLGCGFAHDEITIDVLRAFQGIGGAAVIPAGLGILAHAFPPSRARAIAFSTFAAGAPVGAAVGMLIGGVLTELTRASWRSAFFLMSGLSLVVFLGGWLSFDADVVDKEGDRRIDWLGAFLITTGLVLIIFVLSDGSIAPHGWKTSFIIALLVIGVVLVALFIVWQLYLERLQDRAVGENALTSRWTPPPLVKLSVWKRANGRMSVMLLIGFLEWASFLSFAFWVQLYYQNYLHLSPILTMIRLLPMFVTGIICNLIVALFIGRVDFALLIVVGTSMTSLANLLFAVIRRESPYWAFGFPAAIVCVFGADFVFAAGSLFVAKISLPHEQSVTGALLQTMMQLGSSFGLAITTIIFNAVAKPGPPGAGFPPPPPEMDVHPPSGPPPLASLSPDYSPPPPFPFSQGRAYKAAMWGGFVFGIVGTLLAVIFLRGVGVIGHPPSPPPAQKADDEEMESPIKEENPDSL